MKTKASVIILTYNKASYLDLTLAGYQRQLEKNYEIVIIDDGSTDNTEQVVDEYKKLLPIKYLKKAHGGISAARNLGVQTAESDIIIFTDDDRIPDDTYVLAFVKMLENNPLLAMTGYRDEIYTIYDDKNIINYRNISPDVQESIRRWVGSNNCVNGYRLVSKTDIMYSYNETIKRCMINKDPTYNFTSIIKKYGMLLKKFYFPFKILSGASMGYNRLGALDLLHDEGFIGWGCEDSDFVYNLMERGYQFIWVAEARNHHQCHPVDIPTQKKSFFNNLIYMCKKHMNVDMYLFYETIKGFANNGNRDFKLDDANTVIQYLFDTEDNDPIKKLIIYSFEEWKQYISNFS